MVRVAVGYGTDMYIATGITVKKDLWDERTALYSGRGCKVVNDTLTSILSRVSLKVLELRESGRFYRLTRQQLKDILTEEDSLPSRKKSNTVGALFEKVIKTKNTRNAQLFSQTLQKLTDFADIYSLSFEDITKMWLMQFYASMGSLSVNTKAIHMRNLRNVVNFAIDEGITHFYAFRNYRIPTQETEKRVLTIEKLRYIRDCPHLGIYDREHRDMFMLMFYLIGINIADLAQLTPNDIVDGRIEYRRAKTGKLYSIKIEPEAAEIINKYKGERHLLSCFDRYDNYKDYAQHLNNAIRKIGPIKSLEGRPLRTANHYLEMESIEPKLSTYYARYSWATFAAELDIPKDTISESLGHEYGSKITGVYIKYSRDKIDAANRRVLDYLNAQ